MSETSVQISIVKALRAAGALVIHVPNQGRRDPKTASIMKAMGMDPGCPDLIVLAPKVILFEVKAASGKQSPAQFEWASKAASYGMPVYIVRDARQALAIYDAEMKS